MHLTKKQIAYAMELRTTGLTLHRITSKLNCDGANITLLQLSSELAAAKELGFDAWNHTKTN
jgi:transcriptional regulator